MISQIPMNDGSATTTSPSRKKGRQIRRSTQPRRTTPNAATPSGRRVPTAPRQAATPGGRRVQRRRHCRRNFLRDLFNFLLFACFLMDRNHSNLMPGMCIVC